MMLSRFINNRKKLIRDQKGFTLLEVIVVLAVLAVIVGLVLPNFSGTIGKSKTVMVQGQVEKAKEACFSFYYDTGGCPQEYSDDPAIRQLSENLPATAGWQSPYLERPFLSNDWGGVMRIVNDEASSRSLLNNYAFDVSGFSPAGNDCYLYLDGVPRKVCASLDQRFDGTDDIYNHGSVIYHQSNPGVDKCNLGILLISACGAAASSPPPPPPHYSLTMQVSPVGGGTTTPAEGTYTYAAGTVVPLSAIPSPYWHFSSWTGAVTDPASANTTIIMNDNKSVTATFMQNAPLTLSLQASRDSYIDQQHPATNYGASRHLQVSSYGPVSKYPYYEPADKCLYKNERSLAMFDITGIPAGASIQSASLNLYAITLPHSSRTYGVYQILGSWQEPSVTWNNQPSTLPAVIDTSATPSFHQWMSWDVSTSMQSFIDGSSHNYGWLIKDETENSHPSRTTHFSSREDNGHHPLPQPPNPHLDITYIPR